MTGGLALKGVGVLLYRLFHPPFLGRILVTYDPIADHIGRAALSTFFPRGIAPAGAPSVYEIVIVLVFAVECFILGVMISEARLFMMRHRHTQPS